jgi:hypothetical protein
MPCASHFAERNAGKIAVAFYSIQPIDDSHEDVAFEDVGDALHISRLLRLAVLHLLLDWLGKAERFQSVDHICSDFLLRRF